MVPSPRFVVVCAAILLTAPSLRAAACVDFTSSTFSAGTNPGSVAIGDFNGDTVGDFVLRNGRVYLNNGSGSFSLATTSSLLAGTRDVATGDFDADGKIDVAFTADVGVGPNRGRIRVFFGNNDGTFDPPVDTETVFGAHAAGTGDFNGDGRTDLAYGWRFTSSSAGLNVALSNGNGTFSETATIAGEAVSIRTALFNADANVDIVAVFDNGLVKVALGNGNGTFGTAQNVTVPFAAAAVATGDFNEDNLRDLALSHFNSEVVSILLGAGNGTFGTATQHSVARGPVQIGAGDFNGDGFDDVVTTTSTDFAGVSVLPGNGNGTFDPHEDFVAGTSAGSLVVGKLNGDALSDVLKTSDAAAGTMTVLLAFTPCNEKPVITAGTAVGRTQGTAPSTATVATVSDVETPAGSLTVTATSIPAGLTVTNVVNSGGTVTATIGATCAATVGANHVAFEVTDGGGKVATANFTVNVTANSAPAIGTYPDTSMGPSTSATVTPGAAPSDNGTWTIAATASSGFSGSLTPNDSTGAITINNPNPGTFTISVTMTDNCGSSVTRSFLLSASNLPFGPPQNVVATYQPAAGSVFVTWTGTTNVSYYEVWRRVSQAGWLMIGTSPATWFTDGNEPANAAALYMVRAVSPDSEHSTFSPADVAVTTALTDETIVPGVTRVRLVHLTEIRNMVDIARALIGLTPYPWTATTPIVRAAEWSELRTAIDDTRAAIGAAPVVYTEPVAGTVKAIHVNQTRTAIR